MNTSCGRDTIACIHVFLDILKSLFERSDIMQFVNNEKFICIMERALNLIDPKLISHGKRVAYRLFKSLYPLQIYDDEKLRDICMLGLLHDIGAYKTEDINAITNFEMENVWNHPIYGYLFLKYFSPLGKLAPVVAFHHAKDNQMTFLSEENKMLAKLLKASDRADILQHFGAEPINFDNTDIDKDDEFNRVFRHTLFTDKEIDSFLKMIVFSIDFRSPQTMLHTFAASNIAVSLAYLAHADIKQIERLKSGALMHDIGKMGTPLHILEGTAAKLSKADMSIMKEHVVLSETVLKGCVDEDILNIAINHHEKLNGKGYPKGLSGSTLPFLDRIMAVADVFSAMCVARSYQNALPKEKVVQILNNMKNDNLLDKAIINLAVDNYDKIIKDLDIKSKSIVGAYEDFMKESHWIHQEIANQRFDIVKDLQ